LRFDIVFLDACHEYDCSHRDLQTALNLVNDDGIIVVHDCLPENRVGCAPFRGDIVGGWFGVTYKAYLDVLMARDDLWYCTVDTDVGCGMIRSTQKTDLYKRAIDSSEACIREWCNVGDDYSAAYQVFERNRNVLMNVVPVGVFLNAERQSRSFKSKLRHLVARRRKKAEVAA
jgi:hypothetical protein